MARLLGIVLAGGRGRRLGLETPKALVRVAGRTLLERAVKTLEGICDEVVVCAPTSVVLPVDPSRRVADAEPGEGPLAALVAGLRSRSFESALALGVDLPFLPIGMLRFVAGRLGGAVAVVPAPAGRPQPLAACYAAAALEPLAAAYARGERALVPAVLALGPRLLRDAELSSAPGGPAAFFNLNTAADLDEAERRFTALEGR